MPRHRVLVVGGGSIGERHVRCFGHTGRAEVALCEIDDAVRTRVSSTYDLREAFTDFDAALGADFDAAVICTPAHLHVPMATRLAERGTHLLIEKPLSTTTDGVDALLEAVRSRNVVASVAYVYRAHPAVRAMREAIASGRFGRPVQIVAVSGQHFPLYRPAYRDVYYRSRDTGGGAVQDALTHVVNAAEWLVGPVTELAADAAHRVLEGVDVEDTVHVVARLGDVLGSFSLNQHQAPNESATTVVCEGGTVRFEMHRHRWLSATDPGAEWTVEEEFPLERDDLFVRQAGAFLDAVEGTAGVACSLAEALQTLKVNRAILRAADERRWVPIEEENR